MKHWLNWASHVPHLFKAKKNSVHSYRLYGHVTVGSWVISEGRQKQRQRVDDIGVSVIDSEDQIQKNDYC
ncbi:hypothetical protein MRB53_008294 [Persea americana]|uniref:Uncharacterized protein n=1 Tax=Persea americana TaxID=3435 RepID=A0ACC2MLM9_PERAE|nr:hypothetical protein MRB53_008294 [Persea americana]